MIAEFHFVEQVWYCIFTSEIWRRNMTISTGSQGIGVDRNVPEIMRIVSFSWISISLRRDFDRSRFGLVQKRSDFYSSGSVNRKHVYGSVCDQSEPSSWAGSVQFGSIWRTCICENNKIVTVIIMLMFLQRFKYTDHYYIANIWCSRRNAHK